MPIYRIPLHYTWRTGEHSTDALYTDALTAEDATHRAREIAQDHLAQLRGRYGNSSVDVGEPELCGGRT